VSYPQVPMPGVSSDSQHLTHPSSGSCVTMTPHCLSLIATAAELDIPYDKLPGSLYPFTRPSGRLSLSLYLFLAPTVCFYSQPPLSLSTITFTHPLSISPSFSLSVLEYELSQNYRESNVLQYICTTEMFAI